MLYVGLDLSRKRLDWQALAGDVELAGWDVRIADAAKARGIAPLACKTDTIDTWVLAELARLELVPEIWLPDPEIRAERERARFRLHLVKHRSALKNRVHAILFQHGVANPVSDLFGAAGRALLERLCLPEPWASTVGASLALIDVLDEQISACERELRELGARVLAGGSGTQRLVVADH